MIRRKKGLSALSDLIAGKITSSNSGASLLSEMVRPGFIGRLMALRGSVFSRREDGKVRQFLADFFASEIVAIADGESGEETPKNEREASARSKLRIDVRKWLMEQYAPDLYATKAGSKGQDAMRLPSAKIYLPENGRS